MSFFGFDTSLPRDRAPPSSGTGRGAGLEDDPFDPMGGMDDEALDAKIRGLTAGAQEDVEIYEWGGEGYDGLGDMLDEAGDDLNADTFGGASEDIGKDFDFGHGGSTGAAPSQAPAGKAAKPVDSMFTSNFDEFWALPSLSKASARASQPPPPSQEHMPMPHPATPSAPAPASATNTRTGKTMEEIEAELRASRISQPEIQSQQAQQLPPPPPASGRRPMTMEEVEAEMRSQRQHQGPPPPPPGYPMPPMFPGVPMGMPQMAPPMGMPQQPGQSPMPAPSQAGGLPPSDFPPLGESGPQGPPGREPARAGPPGGMRPQPGGNMPPAAAAMHQAHASSQAQQAEHFARMQNMLRALPESVQQGITSLPPHAHFDVLQGICGEFAVLLQKATTDEDRMVQGHAEQAALGRLRVLNRLEGKRAAREAKIAAMSRYNNVMSVSDKEFITRIQISQILPADPYVDDFYAHIYFALRGRPGPNPGLMGATPQPAQPPKGPKKGLQRMNAQQKAMLRMQQQVERLVADRKSRIEKAAQGTTNPNLEGALGKVGMNVAGNPRQALQIKKDADDASAKQSASQGSTSAADVVRQALQGASLDAATGTASAADGGRRPPLTKHQALRILENLYDIALSLEQLRRSAGDDVEAQAQQEALTTTLWKELRVLEPLEVSDPHPFVSLLNTTKGKRLLPRALRLLSAEQTLTALTMIVASFDSLDVVRDAGVLDDVSAIVSGAAPSEKKRDIELQTDIFSSSIVPSMLGLMATSPFKIVIGMLALFVERNDVVKVVRSRAGIAFLTILLSRAETLRQTSANAPANGNDDAPAKKEDGAADLPAPTAEEQAQWSSIFQLLFERLVTGSGGLSNLFPSTRARQHLPFGVSLYMLQQQGVPGRENVGSLLQSSLDELDEPVWNLYAALAVSSGMEQQSILVQELREKILENVLEARSKADSQEGARKLRLVNIFLNALNLDASQITV